MIFNKKPLRFPQGKQSKLTRAEKNVLWSNIQREITKDDQKTFVLSREPRMPFLFLFRFKFALASFLVIALLGGSAGVVSASNRAVPGDALFPIDTAIEKLQLIFSRGNKKNTLRIKFAEERLQEVKTVLAFENNTNAATEDDSSSTTTKDSADKNTSLHIAKSETALLVALTHLEQEKDKLEASGDTIAAAIIDDIIAELNDIALNHVQHLNKLVLKIEQKTNKGKNNGIKIAFEASSHSVTTKFKFERKENGKSNEKKQRGNGRFKFDFDTEGGGNNEDDDDNEDGDDENDEGDDDNDNDDDKDKKKSKNKKHSEKGRTKISICHKSDSSAHTIRIASAAARAHLSHGDTLGACDIGEDGEEDNDDDTGTTTPDTIPPIISNLFSQTGTTTAEISWDTDELATSKVWYSDTTPVDTENDSFMNSNTLTTHHSISLTSLSASTTYYYVVSSTDEEDNIATSSETSFTTLPEEDTAPEDILAPVISNIEITTATTSAEVIWDTNEASDSIVWYSTTTPVDTENDSFVSTATLVTNHTISLTGLTDNTTYYIVISSSDEALNKAESTEMSFTTLEEIQEPEDTTPPVISDISAISTTTSATISWTTDEEATSKVWYGTTTSLVITNETLFEESGSLTLSHSLTVSTLTASTTYYYFVSSEDTSENRATSSEQSFTTLP